MGGNVNAASEELKNLIFLMLSHKPTLRPSIVEIKQFILQKLMTDPLPSDEEFKADWENRKDMM